MLGDVCLVQCCLRYYKEFEPRAGTTTFNELLNLAEAGDANATKALAQQALYIGRGLRLIIAGLSPAVILIAGDITRRGTALDR